MSFRRDLAKAVLREVISAKAEGASRELRSSSRRNPPGLVRDSKRALAGVSDELSRDPTPVINLLEAWWDRPEPARPRTRRGSL